MSIPVPAVLASQNGDPRTVEIKEVNVNYCCCFCGRHEINPVEWGVMLKLDDIVTHHFCLLFSSGISQNGSDNEGFQGFMPNDIMAELRRGKRLKCKYCKKMNATIGCGVGKCTQAYHFPCGYENGCVAEFYGQFQSFCPKHKTLQDIPPGTPKECPICYMDTEDEEVIWPPCCGKQVFHRRCISHTAKAAGYSFKCPLCNSTQPTFLMAMKANGVYIPDEDATWETEPNAYQELHLNYTHCDAKKCLCPSGREFNCKGPRNWCLVRCYDCGHSATHMKCSNLRRPTWQCIECKLVEENSGLREVEDIKDGADAASIGSSTSTSVIGCTDFEVSITRLRHSYSVVDIDDSSSEDEVENRICNRPPSVIGKQPTQTNVGIPKLLPEHPTGSIQVPGSHAPNIIIPANGRINVEPISPRRSFRQRQSRIEKLLNSETVSPVHNLEPNPALGVVLMEQTGLNSSREETRSLAEVEESRNREFVSHHGTRGLDPVAKEDGLGVGCEVEAWNGVEPTVDIRKETAVKVNIDVSDDEVVEIEPDIVIEKVLVRVPGNEEAKSNAFRALLRRKRGIFSPGMSTAAALLPSRRPWQGRSIGTVCLDEEDTPGGSSGTRNGRFGTRHHSQSPRRRKSRMKDESEKSKWKHGV